MLDICSISDEAIHHVAAQCAAGDLASPGPEADLVVDLAGTSNATINPRKHDDVLAQSCAAVLKAHNKHFNTDLTPDDFESYYPHRNRGWGSVEGENLAQMLLNVHYERLIHLNLTETNDKLHWLHKELNVLQWAKPVMSVREALLKLKAIGHPLHIVTARSQDEKPFVIEWLKRHDLFDLWEGMHFIGAFQFVTDIRNSNANANANTNAKGSLSKESEAAEGDNPAAMEQRLKDAFLKSADKNSKVAVSGKSINAALLIDDHVLNVDKAARAGVECLLFGDKYRWNQRRWGMETPEDVMPFEERKQAGLPLPPLNFELSPGVERAADWSAVVEWVVRWDNEAMLTDTVVLH
ncbi:hypothetical protein QFC19_001876 [Naganishia cerealis]|uniref:Uncharacterized protein n=1 Tax=Naganishia cerealis TaxID=610337 RepID=A0ACC2WEQ1_9TREE|nr:hypothetical protein QFC19_001876 [Naganishia cerealis]